jgi:hypothetical protein
MTDFVICGPAKIAERTVAKFPFPIGEELQMAAHQ